jgi:hypothetical protein
VEGGHDGGGRGLGLVSGEERVRMGKNAIVGGLEGVVCRDLQGGGMAVAR